MVCDTMTVAELEALVKSDLLLIYILRHRHYGQLVKIDFLSAQHLNINKYYDIQSIMI